MSALHYIDIEPPLLSDEWTSVVQNGSSTVERLAAAAWPERGSFGLRITIDGASAAYATKDTGYTIPVGGKIFVGFPFYAPAYPSDATVPFRLNVGATKGLAALTYDNGDMYLYVYNDAGGSSRDGPNGPALHEGRWHYVVHELQRASSDVASDGEGRIYVDGHKWCEATGVDNYDALDGEITAKVGITSSPKDGYVMDIDEVKISTTYPQPYCPDPLTAYNEPRRTVVLYRQDSVDSCEFADYCAEQLGIPRANLCPLVNSTGTESLPDELRVQQYVTDDMDAWFALNSDAADRCTCFLIGYNVPGFFTEAATLHSIASRLMRYGEVFASQTDNPFYGSSTRPTATALAAAGVHLCVRIDADTLQHAKDIIDAAATVTALDAIPDWDRLCSDDSTLLGSLAVQKLRISTAAAPLPQYGAFLVGDDIDEMGDLPNSGSLVGILELATNAQTTLRSAATPMATGLLTGGYASGFGFSALGDDFDGQAFFDGLRKGWTLAEAFLVAVEHLDYTAVPVGDPLMTVAFAKAGHNIYYGLSDPLKIDWANPAACIKAGVSELDVPIDLQAGQKHLFAARAVSQAGIEEGNCEVLTFVEVDGQSQLVDPPLVVPSELAGELISADSVRLDFSCYTTAGRQMPSSFDILTDNGTGTLDLETPAETVAVVDVAQTDYAVTVDIGSLPCMFAVRARLGDASGRLTGAVTVRPPTEVNPPELF